MDAPEYPHHSRPFEKCIVRKNGTTSNEEDQYISELHAEENKGDKSGEILINSVDFHLQLFPIRFND